MSRSGAQLARYLYYLGRIRAVQLDYSEAKDCLQQAARKVGTSACSVLYGSGPRMGHAIIPASHFGCLHHAVASCSLRIWAGGLFTSAP